MDKFIIFVLVVALGYILYLYFKVRKLEKVIERNKKKFHDAAIIISAHKTVLINKVIHYTNDTRDISVIMNELDEEVAECCAFMAKHEEELLKRSNKDGVVTIKEEEE